MKQYIISLFTQCTVISEYVLDGAFFFALLLLFHRTGECAIFTLWLLWEDKEQ